MTSEHIVEAGRFSGMPGRLRFLCCCLAVWGVLGLSGCGGYPAVSAGEDVSVHRTRVFLAAADYRRAIEESQRHVMERPSALSYAESLATADCWVAVELSAASPGAGRPEDLLDSPDIVARIAKELIQASAGKQSDVSAAKAAQV